MAIGGLVIAHMGLWQYDWGARIAMALQIGKRKLSSMYTNPGPGITSGGLSYVSGSNWIQLFQEDEKILDMLISDCRTWT